MAVLHTPLSAPGGAKHKRPVQQGLSPARHTAPEERQESPQRPVGSQWWLQQSASAEHSKPFSAQISPAQAWLAQLLEQHSSSRAQGAPAARQTKPPQCPESQ
jgi:hypothetical protein